MIGQRLKELRISHGIKSKADAARIFDMPYTTYVNYENGNREPGSEELLKFASKYNVTIDYLLGRHVPANVEHFAREPVKVETFARTPVKVETFTRKDVSESEQKKEAAPIMEQLPADRREFLEEIIKLNDYDFQMAKDLLDVVLRKRGGGTP